MSSERREKHGIEASIQEAIERGEFDNLEGKGKPLDLDDYFSAPEDVRVGLSLLKESGFLPREVELLNEIAALEEEIRIAPEAKSAALRKSIREKRLTLDLLLEQTRGHARRRR